MEAEAREGSDGHICARLSGSDAAALGSRQNPGLPVSRPESETQIQLCLPGGQNIRMLCKLCYANPRH